MSDVIRKLKTPAAIKARVVGDWENALIAATPGGIEAQEAAGQRDLCASAKLPKVAGFNEPINRELYEAMGIIFGSDADDLFVNVTLPAGWKIRATDHSMWNELVDGKGRKRASIFYKAAFYDCSAHISLATRFNIESRYCNAAGEPAYEGNRPQKFEPTHCLGEVTDSGGTVFTTSPLANFERREDEDSETRIARANKHSEGRDAQRKECADWLAQNYPDWKNPLAYWEVE